MGTLFFYSRNRVVRESQEEYFAQLLGLVFSGNGHLLEIGLLLLFVKRKCAILNHMVKKLVHLLEINGEI